MSFTATSSNWIWAYKRGTAVNSDSVSASVSQHTENGGTSFNLVNAAGGSNSNPFLATAASATSSSLSSAPSDSSPSGSSSGGSEPSDNNLVVMAHGILTPIAFVVMFPLGAISIRLLSFNGIVWFHAGWMVFTYIMVLASMGMGVWIAVTTQQLDTTHAIIGLVVVGCLLVQPVTGLTHHLLYKRTGQANVATYPHIWWGRAVVTLGIINGGLGLQLSANTTKGEIAYGVVAGFMWLLWMVVIIISFRKSRKPALGKEAWATEMQNTSSERIRIGYPESLQQELPDRDRVYRVRSRN